MRHPHPAEKLLESFAHTIRENFSYPAVIDAFVESLRGCKAPIPDALLFPLFRAALSGKNDYALIKLLPFITTETVWTYCLILAISLKSEVAKKELLHVHQAKYDFNVVLDITDEELNGKTILESACEHGDLSILKWLRRQRVNIVGLMCAKGKTALHIASEKGYLAIVEFLIQKYARICCIDDSGFTPLLLALNQGHKTVALYLLQEGAGIFERFNESHCATLLEFKLEREFFEGATVDGKPFPADFFLSGKDKEEEGQSDERIMHLKEVRIFRLKEILSTPRQNKQVLECLEKHEFKSLKKLALAYVLQNQGMFKPEILNSVLKEIGYFQQTKADQVELIENLEGRIQFIKEMMEAFEAAIILRAKWESFGLVGLVFMFGLIMLAGAIICALRADPLDMNGAGGMYLLGAIMLPIFSGASLIGSIGAFLGYFASPRMCWSEDGPFLHTCFRENGKIASPIWLRNGESVRNRLNAFVALIQEESAESPNALAPKIDLENHLYNSKSKMGNFLDALESLKTYYEAELHQLRHNLRAHFPKYRPLLVLSQHAENRQLLPNAFFAAVPARVYATDEEEIPLLIDDGQNSLNSNNGV